MVLRQYPPTKQFQQQDAPLPIQCIERLPKIKEETVKRLELKVCKLLGQFCLDDCGASAATVAAAMEAVMQLNGIESVVDDAFNTLPNGLPFGIKTTMDHRSWRGIVPWIHAAWTSRTKRHQLSPVPTPVAHRGAIP